MYNKNYKNEVIKLFENHFNEKVLSINQLNISGSSRIYFRIKNNKRTVIGAYNEDLSENKAFFYFTKFFTKKKLPVPELIAQSINGSTFLLQDLGDTTLFDLLTLNKSTEVSSFPIDLYKKSLAHLIHFQLSALKGLDFEQCYPIKEFSVQAIKFDLNYFKYYFLKPTNILHNENLLENDFNLLSNKLGQKSKFFMYRDFQARNIMILNNEPYFIDYQGGRQGPLEYDLASLLFQAKAQIPEEIRNELIEFYLENLSITIDKNEFRSSFFEFALLRTMQVLGAYGFRGYFEGKSHFISSIPFAIHNLKFLISNIKSINKYTELLACLTKICHKYEEQATTNINTEFQLVINSFSFKKKLPVDYSGNGGGFVFDCRALPNPGRLDEFKNLSGLDEPVKSFFKKHHEIDSFNQNVLKTVDPSIRNYLKRGFKNLMVSFGCTGGQHRSVFCAETLKRELLKNYDINIIINHLEKENWPNY